MMKAILQIQDELNVVYDIVECAFHAANEAEPNVASPLRTVLDLASKRIREIEGAVDRLKDGMA